MIVTVIQTKASIQKATKLESSLLAERITDENGTPKFEQLVFDEEYDILFRDLFFDARANVTSKCMAYMKDEIDDSLFQSSNFDTDVDFILQLDIDGFITSMKDSVDIKMKAYIVAYIMYRWLETKLPGEASVYFQRAKTSLDDMVRFLELRKTRSITKNWAY